MESYNFSYFRQFADWLIERARSRPPGFIIGGADNPYMLRWYLTPWSGDRRIDRSIPETRWQRFLRALPGAYIHLIVRSDDDRALHDHPWGSCSILLQGSYVEHSIAAGGVHSRIRVSAGDVVFRHAEAAHRLEIDAGPAWSLFLFWRRRRKWGFHCPNGWVPWEVFTNSKDGGATIGRGCE